jgi:hypothetical protein
MGHRSTGTVKSAEAILQRTLSPIKIVEKFTKEYPELGIYFSEKTVDAAVGNCLERGSLSEQVAEEVGTLLKAAEME